MLNITVGQLFHASARRFPRRLCVETAEGAFSYSWVNDLTDRLAAALRRRGLDKGSRVGLWCKDSPAFLYVYLALEKLGCVPVLLNTSLGGAELRVLLQKADARLLLFDEGYKGVSFPEIAATLDTEGVFIPTLLADLPPLTAEELAALAEAKEAVKPKDADVVIFTSGTSGAAKGVLTTHLARVNVARAQAEMLALTEDDKLLVAIPMYHCFGLTGVVLAALYCGASLYFPPERRTRYLLEAAEKFQCTVFSAVPTLFSAVVARADLAEHDISSFRAGYIGGAVYTPEFFRRVEKALGFSLSPSLGQTEATAGLTFLPPGAPERQRAETVGRFLPGIEGEIRDTQTGRPLPAGQTGEICIRGFSVMEGYVSEPELTRETVDELGWLHTGDLAWRDAEGCLHMAGRRKELIIRGGENIAPGEIEAAILADPRVREVKAVAVPDAHYGEEICACVVLRDGGAPMDEGQVRALVAANLADFKVPRYVLFLPALPRTGSGKQALAALKNQAREALGL